MGPTRRGKGSKIMAIGDRHGLPVPVHVASASPHEVTLFDATLAARFLYELPERLNGNRGYDSDHLDQHLAVEYDIELIAPHNAHCRRRTQDGRSASSDGGGAGRLIGSSPAFTTSRRIVTR
jgi:hypothetical protein